MKVEPNKSESRKPSARPELRSAGKNHRGGFALVVTLSLMILLTVIAVGLLTLSSITLRKTAEAQHASVARANARLAMLVALGELQKELGPDRRISANAAILDENPDSVEANGISQPHCLGVWESWNTWLTDPRAGLTIQQTYQPGRHPSLFRRWLISDPSGGRDPLMVKPSGITGETSLLVGATNATDRVFAPKIPVAQGAASSGAIAWWIADESQKARINLHERQAAGKPQDAQMVAGHAGRPGVEKMDAMSDFKTDKETLDRMITTGQATLTAKDADKRFHDLTAYSAGLLTDVRAGGFKGDLNHAFERDTENQRPTEMRQQVTMFGTPFDPPIRPMSGVLSSTKPKNPYIAPVSWRQMTEFYRLYRTGGANIHKPVTWSGSSPFTRPFLMGRRGAYEHIMAEQDTKGYTRQLLLLRQTWIIATRVAKDPVTGTNRYYVSGVPFSVYWNPYNVPMKVSSNQVSSVASLGLATGLQCIGYDSAGTPIGSPTLISSTYNNTRLGYMSTIREIGNGDIEFKPGEVRAFSLRGAAASGGGAGGYDNRFFADPGYEPLVNTVATRGLQEEITALAGSVNPTLSLKLVQAAQNDNYFWGNSDRALTVGMYHNDGTSGLYHENGTDMLGGTVHQRACTMGVYSIDWFTPSDIGDAWLVGKTAATRARWNPLVSYPVPVAIISMIAKSPERMRFENNSASYAKDFGNRTWLHAPPTGLSAFLMNPGDLTRSDSSYQLHFHPVNGDQEVSQFLQVNGRNAYFGGGYGPATGQTQVVALEIPSAPVTNLGGFAGMRLDHSRAQKLQPNAVGSPHGLFNMKHVSHTGAAFGPGIGNAYAHPMISPDKVYSQADKGADQGHPIGNYMSTTLNAFDDQWDHLFLANEGLWDSWFCSGITPEVTAGSLTKSRRSVAQDFFNGTHGLVSKRLQPYASGKTPAQLVGITDATIGWQQISAHLLNAGQFNVNSTSKEAWKAILMGLRDRPVAWQDGQSGTRGVRRDGNQVVVSRFNLANGAGDGGGPNDRLSWLGVRTITEAQIDELANQMVRQVKLRGPFLNMAEFVNRRLTADRTGVTGAIQAAIDADEFDAGYNGTPSGTGGINASFKRSTDMISAPVATYPNPKAALGSRYAGIPGYVMQSDLLQGLGSSIGVRGDTFMIRGYGESRASNGKIMSRAWCETVVQRVPEFIDPTDAHDKWLRAADGSPVTVQNPSAEPALSAVNKLFGRRFNIISFKWLPPVTS